VRRSRTPGVVLVVLAVVGVVGATFWLTRSSPKVLLIGDSLMAETAPYVKRSASADVTSVALPGTGLVSRQQFDWVTASQRLASRRPDVVVALFVGNCRDPAGLDPAHPVPCDSPAFFAQWGQAADAITTAFEQRGAHVYWVIPPPMREPVYEARVTELTTLYRDLARTHPHVGFVDGRRALGTPSGAFLATAPGPAGRPEPLRTADGVHLTDLGAQRLAQAIVSTTALG